MSFDPSYTYFQTALLLGVSRRDIHQWVSDGELSVATDGKYSRISENSIVDFLKRCPEHVGRVYCDDLPIFIEERKRIVSHIDI